MIADRRDALLAHLAGGGPVEVVETHVSVLAFQGDRVYKLKKPVEFDFLDLSTRARREAICHREVELNRRLCPDVYLGVVDLRDAAGTTVDHAVVMRRMPPERRLTTLVARAADVDACLGRLASDLARFHGAARTAPEIDAAASPEAVADLWEHGFAETAPFAGPVLPPETVARVERLARRYVTGRGSLFRARIAAGRARDGHGDLLADDVFCLDDGPRALDCLEFDDRLRYGDGLADAAFLAMDLELHGRPDLARAFLDEYRERAADAWPVSLEDHYVAYRAHVRAKVACLRHAQGDPGAAARARERLDLCRAHLEHGRVRLVLLGGAPGTGKSTVATALAAAEGWVALRSDVVRKELAGLAPEAPARAPIDTGLYTTGWTARTYDELLGRAADLLARGETVVLDASWSVHEQRDRARAVAAQHAADIVELCCVAPAATAAERIRARAGEGRDASDANEAVASAMRARFETWATAMAIDTAGTVADAVAVARAACT